MSRFGKDIPVTLWDAVDVIMSSLTDEDIQIITASKGPWEFHHTIGRRMRNEWKLWQEGTPLHEHFKRYFGLGHADDMSGMILGAVDAKVKGHEFNPEAKAEDYQNYWYGLFIDPKTQTEIIF